MLVADPDAYGQLSFCTFILDCQTATTGIEQPNPLTCSAFLVLKENHKGKKTHVWVGGGGNMHPP